MAVSPDGRRVVTGSSDCSARVWNPETGREELFLHGHREALDAIAFSPDGSLVATTSLDGTIKIWDARSSTEPIVAAASQENLSLASGYLPVPLRLAGDPANREIRSIRVVGGLRPQGNGEAELYLDTREAELNSFGDVVGRLGPEPIPIRVELRYVATGSGQVTNQGAALRGFKAV